MKCIVINLERATERREHIIREFGAHDVQYEFFTGKDKRHLTENDFQAYAAYDAKFSNWKHPHFKGHFACWLSHREVWKKAVLDGENMIAVFEDDVKLLPDINDGLKLIEELTDQFDIIFLNNRFPGRPFVPIVKLSDEFMLGLIKFAAVGTEGYVITSRAMRHLLDIFPHFDIEVDRLMSASWLHGLKTFHIQPNCVFHGAKEFHVSSYICVKNEGPNVHRRTLTQNIRYFFDISVPKRLEFYRRTRNRKATLAKSK